MIKTIYKTIEAAIHKTVADTTQPMGQSEIIEPLVVPSDIQILPTEIEEQVLLKYADQIILASNFQLFMELLERIVNELRLDLTQDLPKIAAVANKYRISQNLEPL
jgi:hypothetical protein